MINILLSGCNGKMGQVISSLTDSNEKLNIAAGYDITGLVKNDYSVFKNLSDCDVKVDVIIDFSSPAALKGLIEYATSNKTAIVVATTGLSHENELWLKNAAMKVPVFFSANMSVGISLIVDLVKRATKVLEKGFDIEIIEKHHNQKVDAPSGTALKIADSINSVLEKKSEYVYDRHSRRRIRSKREIGIHAVRGGTIVGEHSVMFAGEDEIIEINHIAMSKDIFGVGALRAAEFIYNKEPGMYNMEDLVDSYDL